MSGLNQRFTKPSSVTGPWVRISPPPHIEKMPFYRAFCVRSNLYIKIFVLYTKQVVLVRPTNQNLKSINLQQSFFVMNLAKVLPVDLCSLLPIEMGWRKKIKIYHSKLKQ